MKRSLPLWGILSAGAVVCVGCGIFFAFQDLGTATDYAAIASFFLALVTAAGSLLSFAHPKQEQKQEQVTAPQAGQGEQPALGSMLVFGDPKIAQLGNDNTAHYTETHKLGRRARKGKR